MLIQQKSRTFIIINKIKIAYLIINKSFSNFFITLCDRFKKVIICKSSGASIASNRKKMKTATQAIESIVLSLKPYFFYHNIKGIRLQLKVRATAHVYTLIKHLTLLNIKIVSVEDIKRVPHNGMRARKPRRV